MTPVPALARERRLAYVAWVTICVVWGKTYLAIRVALESVPVANRPGVQLTLKRIEFRELAGLSVLAAQEVRDPGTGRPVPVPLVPRFPDFDDIPGEIDIAIPRGSWTPETTAPVRWRHFDPGTFEIGRDQFDIGAGRTIGLYSAERSIIDAFRMRHLDGSDLANEALKRWLRRGGRPSALLGMARSFPRVLTALRETLEILL